MCAGCKSAGGPAHSVLAASSPAYQVEHPGRVPLSSSCSRNLRVEQGELDAHVAQRRPTSRVHPAPRPPAPGRQLYGFI